jgi:hypothetical protein
LSIDIKNSMITVDRFMAVREEEKTPEIHSASTIMSKRHLKTKAEQEKVYDLVDSYTIKSR